MEIKTCPHCGTNVVITADGICPSCRQRLEMPDKTSEPISANPFAEATHSGQLNPYAVPNYSANEIAQKANPLLVPAILMLVLSILGLLGNSYSFLYFYRLFERDRPPTYLYTYFGVFIFLIESALCFAGSICMLRRRNRTLALVGAWAAVIPTCGCYLVTMSLGIWSLKILNRPEVKESFTR